MEKNANEILLNNVTLGEIIKIFEHSNTAKVNADEVLLFIKLWYPEIYYKMIDNN